MSAFIWEVVKGTFFFLYRQGVLLVWFYMFSGASLSRTSAPWDPTWLPWLQASAQSHSLFHESEATSERRHLRSRKPFNISPYYWTTRERVLLGLRLHMVSIWSITASWEQKVVSRTSAEWSLFQGADNWWHLAGKYVVGSENWRHLSRLTHLAPTHETSWLEANWIKVVWRVIYSYYSRMNDTMTRYL